MQGVPFRCSIRDHLTNDVRALGAGDRWQTIEVETTVFDVRIDGIRVLDIAEGVAPGRQRIVEHAAERKDVQGASQTPGILSRVIVSQLGVLLHGRLVERLLNAFENLGCEPDFGRCAVRTREETRLPLSHHTTPREVGDDEAIPGLVGGTLTSVEEEVRGLNRTVDDVMFVKVRKPARHVLKVVLPHAEVSILIFLREREVG